MQKKEKFLGIISESEDLNRRIAKNARFDLDRDYIREYVNVLNNFISKIWSLSDSWMNFIDKKDRRLIMKAAGIKINDRVISKKEI